jgi:hypothetical protein
VVLIHVDQRLIKGQFLCFEEGESPAELKREFQKEAVTPEALLTFCETVSELDGMEQHIDFGRYDIQLEKAVLFSWKKLLPHIVEALRTFIAKDEKMQCVQNTKKRRKRVQQLRQGN